MRQAGVDPAPLDAFTDSDSPNERLEIMRDIAYLEFQLKPPSCTKCRHGVYWSDWTFRGCGLGHSSYPACEAYAECRSYHEQMFSWEDPLPPLGPIDDELRLKTCMLCGGVSEWKLEGATNGDRACPPRLSCNVAFVCHGCGAMTKLSLDSPEAEPYKAAWEERVAARKEFYETHEY